jgi:NAD-dependent SIR2 family protein deacetylase
LRGQDLFDSRLFQDAKSTTTFYRFISVLREKIHNEVKDTSATHKFIRTMRDGGRLMRCYTQNIDGLEAREGLCTDLRRGKGNKRRFMKKHYEAPMPQQTQGTDFDGGCEVVQLHGDLETLRCTVCATQFTWTDNETEIFVEGCAPKCVKCAKKSYVRQATGKRGLSVGSLRPNIVLYGEDHPSNSIINPFPAFDASCQPDVLIIMGTSLKVYGLQKIVREFAKAIHEKEKGKVIFVNRTRPAESTWENTLDTFVSMDCDDWVADLKTRRPDLWLRQGEIDLKATKPKSTKRKRNTEPPEGEVGDRESAARPKKKVRITVEIPAKKASLSQRKSLTQTLKQTKPEPSTPRHQKGRPPVFQVLPDETSTPLRNIFKTPRRPAYSPITPGFSPITPTELKPSPLSKRTSRVLEAVIEERDHEEEVVNRPVVKSSVKALERDSGRRLDETPSKGPMGRTKDVDPPRGQENMQAEEFSKWRRLQPKPVQEILWGDVQQQALG